MKVQSHIPDSRLLLMSALTFLLVLTFALMPVNGYSDWKEVDTILTEAFGDEVARDCADYYNSLDIAENEMGSVRDAIARLVEAGYPSRCPREYLKVAADLSRAGIDLADLTNKIREGIAKKVSPERLNKVIANRAEALQEARVVVLNLEESSVQFLDRQMAYTVIADYLLRGVSRKELEEKVVQGDLGTYTGLSNLIR